jgi:hypothetical protein
MLTQELQESHWITHSKFHCITAYVKSSFRCRTFSWTRSIPPSSANCQLRNSQSNSQLLLSSLLTYLRRDQLSTNCTLGTQLTLLSWTLLYNHFDGPNRKHRFQQYPYFCVFSDPLLRNGFFYCCVRIRCRGNVFTDLFPRKGLHKTVVHSPLA